MHWHSLHSLATSMLETTRPFSLSLFSSILYLPIDEPDDGISLAKRRCGELPSLETKPDDVSGQNPSSGSPSGTRVMEAAAVSGLDLSGGSSSETCLPGVEKRSRWPCCGRRRSPRMLQVLFGNLQQRRGKRLITIYTENCAGQQKSRIFTTVKLTHTTVR